MNKLTFSDKYLIPWLTLLSGLAISASLGVRDNNEASWTQVLDVCEFMSDVTTIPILLDGDTGFGNFNNMRRLVKKLEQRDIAGVCIEDKLFPKTNSFIGGEMQPLADIDEFCGKVKAAKDTQSDENFCVVARVEAFIAGWGWEEALRRGDAYREAGADAILIHSRENNPSQIFSFAQKFKKSKYFKPMVAVPSSYSRTYEKELIKNGYKVIISEPDKNLSKDILLLSSASNNKTINPTISGTRLINTDRAGTSSTGSITFLIR